MSVSTTEFEADLEAGGFVEITSKTWDESHPRTPHAHPFFIRALVTAGELTIRCGDKATTCGAGDTFSMEAGAEHIEIVGAQGVTFLSGRKVPT